MSDDRSFDPCNQGYHEYCVGISPGAACICKCHDDERQLADERARAERAEFRAELSERSAKRSDEAYQLLMQAYDGLREQLNAERARAERAEAELADIGKVVDWVADDAKRDTLAKAAAFWMDELRHWEQEIPRCTKQIEETTKRAEAAEGREARLREATSAFVRHHDNGQAGKPGFPRTYREVDVWQADWDRLYAEMSAALAGTPDDLPATTPRESHPSTIRVTEVTRGAPTIHPDEIDPRDARIAALEGALDELTNVLPKRDARISVLEAALRGIERATLILVEKSRSDGVFGDGVRMALRPVLREIEQARAALAATP